MVARNYKQGNWTLAAILVLAAALAPSGWLAWSWRGMPHTGIYHDDAIYLVAGKSLAEGNGYRIASLPEQPYQTKYPPLYPAVLAAVWKLAPEFPGNLPWVMLATWLSLPLLVYLPNRRGDDSAGRVRWRSNKRCMRTGGESAAIMARRSCANAA
ncbi:MAG: hypothetical protein FJW31_29635, partial [Acidobacteria bacterium]|nr:hypothetical protein [Acidobacteriota bacterium]